MLYKKIVIAVAVVVGAIAYLKYRSLPPPTNHVRVVGEVLEIATEKPLTAKVEILLDNVKIVELKTDKDGAFIVDLPPNNYIGIASAPGYTPSQKRIYVLPEEIGKTLRLLPFLLQRTTPIWAATLYTNLGWPIPIKVNGETYNVGYNNRSPLIPWPIKTGRYVEAPEEIIHDSKLLRFNAIRLSVDTREKIVVWQGYSENRVMMTFPEQYAGRDKWGRDYRWWLMVYYLRV